ncbi:MAG: response regulator transcription factor [Acidobacteriia bacterium]|nr:response regulator transcription factor [Terriglobia bacterium]
MSQDPQPMTGVSNGLVERKWFSREFQVVHSVLLVSSFRLVREAVKALIERHEDFQVIGETDDRDHTLRLLSSLNPDVILVDLDPEHDAAIETIREIIEDRPGIKIVALSMHSEDAIVENALRSGVRGYMSKGGSSADVVEVLKAVARGGAYLSPVAAARAMDWIRNAKTRLNPALESLTQREVQVLRLIAGGKVSKEVASELNLAVETVRTYRKTLMKKLKIHNVAELVQFALAVGVIVIPGPKDSGGDSGGNPT